MMGTIEYRRAVYERKNADGSTNCVFLLDEAMGKSGSGFYSGLLTEIIVNACCNGSYRDAAREVSEMTGQRVNVNKLSFQEMPHLATHTNSDTIYCI
jgi:hypothetical protein